MEGFGDDARVSDLCKASPRVGRRPSRVQASTLVHSLE